MGDQRYYYNRTADPAELANVGIFLASDLATSINGQVIVADSGKTVAAIGDTVIGTVPPMKPLDLY
jgi:enoyl-[acyl-carrier-protein] reductase (NADH)